MKQLLSKSCRGILKQLFENCKKSTVYLPHSFSEAFSLYLTKYLLKLISNTPALSGSEPRLSSSGSSISKEEKVVIRRGSAPAPTDQISLPELDLTPASPVPSPVQLNIEPPTPTVNNRYVDLEGCSGNILHVI